MEGRAAQGLARAERGSGALHARPEARAGGRRSWRGETLRAGTHARMRFCSDAPVKLPTTACVTDVGLCAWQQRRA